jgi:hypothetical protein
MNARRRSATQPSDARERERDGPLRRT